MSAPRILIAGIGNIFKADDGFGVEAVRRLEERLPGIPAEIAEFGIRGFDLAYALLDGAYDGVILLDAVQRGRAPGSLFVIEPDVEGLDEMAGPSFQSETHGMDPARVLLWVKRLGGALPRLRIVGCEPADLGGEEDVRVGLSEPVSAAIDGALALVQDLVGVMIAEGSAARHA